MPWYLAFTTLICFHVYRSVSARNTWLQCVSYSTWISFRGVSGFVTDCPCDVWCRGLTTCLLHVGPPFGNRFLNTSWGVGLTYWIVHLHFLYFGICNNICLDTSYHFWLYLNFLNILCFLKYPCTNIFHRCSLCTFYHKGDCIYWLLQ